jgi:hypothetical protein
MVAYLFNCCKDFMEVIRFVIWLIFLSGHIIIMLTVKWCSNTVLICVVSLPGFAALDSTNAFQQLDPEKSVSANAKSARHTTRAERWIVWGMHCSRAHFAWKVMPSFSHNVCSASHIVSLFDTLSAITKRSQGVHSVSRYQHQEKAYMS